MATRPELEELDDDHIFLASGHDESARRTRAVVVLTALMMLVEIAAGWWTGSMALLADGLHMGTHAGTLALAAAAYAYARHYARDPRYSFGTGKVGDLAGFASALVLGLAALGIAGESILRLFEPARVAFAEATLVAIVGLLVNLVSAAMLHRRDHDHGEGADPHHHHHHDNNLRAAYLHVLADALTSVLAIVALLAGRYLGWLWLDAAVGILGAAMIARWSVGLMRDTAAMLLDASDHRLMQAVRARVEGPGDASIADLHVWRVGPTAYAAIVSVVGGTASREAIAARLADLPELAHLTIECR